MRSETEIVAGAVDRPAFSNGTEWFDWNERWCGTCQTPSEKSWRDYEAGKRKNPHRDYPSGCPLIACVIAYEKTPTEFLEQPFESRDRYHCIEHRGPDDGGEPGLPRPKPDPPGMDGLFDRPERTIRMLSQPSPSEVHA